MRATAQVIPVDLLVPPVYVFPTRAADGESDLGVLGALDVDRANKWDIHARLALRRDVRQAVAAASAALRAGGVIE